MPDTWSSPTCTTLTSLPLWVHCIYFLKRFRKATAESNTQLGIQFKLEHWQTVLRDSQKVKDRSEWGRGRDGEGGKQRFTDRRKVNLDAAVVLQPSGWIQKETQAHLYDSRCVLKRTYAVDYTPTLDFDDPHAQSHTFCSQTQHLQGTWWVWNPSKWHGNKTKTTVNS